MSGQLGGMPIINLEQKLKEDYNREQCIAIWENVKEGISPRFPRKFHQKHNHRKYVIVEFIDEFQEENTNKWPSIKDFEKHKLMGMLKKYDRSPYSAFVSLGYTDEKSENYDKELDETPWIALNNVPLSYWKNHKNVKKAVDWLSKKSKKEINKLQYKDFLDNRLECLCAHYKDSPILVIKEAGYEIDESERDMVPLEYWTKKKNRVNAVKGIVETLDKPLEDLKAVDFKEEGLDALMNHYKNDCIYKALTEAGYDVDRTKLGKQSFWTKKKNRVNTVKGLVETLDKPVHEITSQDFKDNDLTSILSIKSYTSLLTEAGFKVNIMKKTMVPRGYWNKKKNRVTAVKEHVKSLGKPVEEITSKDFKDCRISGLFVGHYKNKFNLALKEAGLI